MINDFFYFKFSKKKIDSFFFVSNNIKVEKFNYKNYEIYIIGLVHTEDIFEVKNLFKKITKYKNDFSFLRTLNSQFLLIIRDTSSNNLEVINSRFGIPMVFYSFDKDNFILSNNLYILLKFRTFKNFLLDNNAAWHFLKFRRVFGNLTLDKNTKYLPSGSKLDFKNFQLSISSYFQPNYEKNRLSLKDNAEQLNYNLKKSINILTKNKNKVSLALSGGTDTRLLLANIDKKIDCYNYTYIQNRESDTAKKIANELNQNFFWKKIPDNAYSKNLTLSSLVNSSMYMADAVHYTNPEFKKYDTVLSGYGLDFMFQGMYLPTKKISLFNKPLYLKVLKKFDKNIIDFFLDNISYKTKGLNIDSILKKNKNYEYINELKINLLDDLLYVSDYTDSDYDKYEYLSLSNISRHYTFGGQLALSQHSQHLIPAYSNELLDLSNMVPLHHKLDSRLSKTALRLINPKLIEIINANHGFKMKFNSLQLTILSGLKKLTNPSKNDFHRTWMGIEKILREDLYKDVLKLEKSNLINEIEFIDMNNFQNFLEDWKKNRIIGDQTLLLLLTINNFLENTKYF
jgi:asparagine synthase (glutamine-hydrolysing)